MRSSPSLLRDKHSKLEWGACTDGAGRRGRSAWANRLLIIQVCGGVREAFCAVQQAFMSEPLIVIATPCFGGVVTQNYMLSVIRLISYAKSRGFGVSLSMVGYDALISRARSTLGAAVLDNPAATHLLFVDAEISFEPQQFERLLRFDKDFVGALYPLKSIDWELIPQRCVDGGESVRQAALSYVGTFCPEAERKQEGDFATGIYVGEDFN
jgi:hypothetical protein